MENFNFYSPTYFHFGAGAEKDTGKLVKRFGGSKVLIHFGGGSVKKNGVLEKVEKSLSDANISFIELGGAMPNPRSGLVYQGIDICKKNEIDFVLAVGGGSAIDSAKAIAAGAVHDGDFWDYYKERDAKAVENSLPVGTVLTISAAGSEGSGNSVITREPEMLKRGAGGEAMRPKFSILNPEFTFTLPPYQTACGITDMMAHVCERYFTNTADVELTDRLCEAILKTIIKEAPIVIKNPDDYQACANIMWAGTLAHNDICGADRVQDWSSHNIEHELSALYDIAHGAGLSVIMPNWMKFVMHHDINRFAQFAVRVWDCDMNYQHPEITAMEGIERFRSFLTSIGMPATFADIGAKVDDIPYLAEKSGYTKERPLGHFVKLGKEEIEEIYRLSL